MPHSRYEKRKHTMLPFFRFAGAGHIPTPLHPLGGEGEGSPSAAFAAIPSVGLRPPNFPLLPAARRLMAPFHLHIRGD